MPDSWSEMNRQNSSVSPSGSLAVAIFGTWSDAPGCPGLIGRKFFKQRYFVEGVTFTGIKM